MTATATLERSAPAAPVATALEELDRRVLVVAGATFALLMAFATRYGWHRDELYFLQSGRHLTGPYVDQPVFTPLVARLSLALFGHSLAGMHLFPALATAGTVVLGGLLARELGGGRRAQLIAALGAATAPAVLANGHLAGPTVYDVTAWSALAVLVVRLGRTRDMKLWVAIGAVTGVGMANKHSIGFFALALGAGLVAAGEARLFRTPWFAAAVAIATAFALPDLVWQAGHHWATIGMTRRLNQKYGGLAGAALFVPAQLGMASVALVGLWLSGLRSLGRASVHAWRAFAWAYALLFPFFALTGGKHPYYLAAMYVVLLAAGAVVVEKEGASAVRRLRGMTAGTAIATALVLPVLLPILPVRSIAWARPASLVAVETVGWPEFLGTVAGAWHGLPPTEQAHAVIFTASYGEASAINELGRPYGLPHAVSGHNNFWYWGPGDPGATTVVAVAPGPGISGDYASHLRRLFGQVTLVARISNRAHISNEEAGGYVYVCRQPVQPWGQLWSRVQHYD